MCTRNALPALVQEFATSDPREMADRSGADFVEGSIIIRYCDLAVSIDHPTGEIIFQEAGRNFAIPALLHEEKAIILRHLVSASGLPVRGQWLSFQDLRGGPLHWEPFQKEALIPLAQHYYKHKEKFLELGIQHGGKPYNKGDAGITVPVFPHLPLTFIIWEGGDEFAPRSTVLFDTVSETYLTTAGLYILAIQAVIRIWFPGDTRFDNRS